MINIVINKKTEINEKINLEIAYKSGTYNLILNGLNFLLVVNFEENQNDYISLMGKKYSADYLYRYGGWTTGLKVLVWELWSRHIEHISEAELLNAKKSYHQKTIKILEFNKTSFEENIKKIINHYPQFSKFYKDAKKSLEAIQKTEKDRYILLIKQMKILVDLKQQMEYNCPEIKNKISNDAIEQFKISNPELAKMIIDSKKNY
ncbi:hypothetical protein [Mycoplasma sp. SG1]|uniref:hypothetical protein n=1 Tax=Mycoplasma sp. SG1 TaxID=2810348 RepID=UPI002024A72B|nr:hypothetical protein [Mycoplasma sp. SG1]URM52997.1 hypothetical protein JRW51_01465 [Mycoplasma sp. SG1]